jgi:hypothetical protein
LYVNVFRIQLSANQPPTVLAEQPEESEEEEEDSANPECKGKIYYI